MREFITNSAVETKELAALVAGELRGGEFISLIGDLGAGKTTFVQGLVAALGGEGRVKSPTFTVMNEYLITKKDSPIKRVLHVDFYRFEDASELSALSLEDEQRSDTIILAEWPNIFKEKIFKPDLTITLEHLSAEQRLLKIF